MKRIAGAILIILITSLSFTPVSAIDDNAGTAGYSFLKIGVGARPAGMASAYVGLADDYSALYYNPAGITHLRLSTSWQRASLGRHSGEDSWRTAVPDQPEDQRWGGSGNSPPHYQSTYLAAAYNSWIADFQSGFLAAIHPVGTNTWLGAAIQYMSYGTLIATSDGPTPEGEFSASDLAFSLTGATRLGDHFALGLTGRFILESIEDSSSWGLAGDLGLMYYLPDGRTQFGLAVTNLGAQMDGLTESHKDKLPTKFAFGASHKLRGLPLIAAADITRAVDDQVRFSLGAELLYFAPFYLRSGYSSRRGDIETGADSDGWSGLSGGFGVGFDQLRLDYAIGRLSELGFVHRVGLVARL